MMTTTLLLAGLAALSTPAADPGRPGCAVRAQHVPAGKIVHSARVMICAPVSRAADSAPVETHRPRTRAKT